MARMLPEASTYVLSNASVPEALYRAPTSGKLAKIDITVTDGKISAITPAGSARAAAILDLDGDIILPGFVDLHTHIDKGHIWARKENPDGTWWGALQAVGADREANWSAEDLSRRMDFSLRCAYAHGTAALRTHLDMSPATIEVTWDVFAQAREKWAGKIELQGVGLMGPDTVLDADTFARIAQNAKTYGGLLGGSTAVHPQNPEIMRRLVETAGNLGLDIDLHTDESPDPASTGLESLADAVLETGFSGKVTAGHCCALAVQEDATAKRVIDKVARAGIAIVSLPMCNMYLQDRDNTNGVRTPRWRGVTLLNELKAAGVKVAIASDNTRDPFYAYGDLDGFEVLREGARILHFDHPQSAAFTWSRSVTAEPAAIAEFAYAGTLETGTSADFSIFKGRSWTELLSRPQADRIVVRAGRAIDTTLPDYRELDDLMRTQ
jgi:cytosine deaminase